MDIDRNAPATDSAETLILASIERVWAVQTDFESWPRWNPAVSRLRLNGAVAPGTEFRWKVGGLPIVSVLQDVEPPHRIAWTGKAAGIRAKHVWTFEDRDDATWVRSEESFSGVLPRVMRGAMRRTLALSLEQAIVALKMEVERRGAEPGRD